jgi:hypothetical protein
MDLPIASQPLGGVRHRRCINGDQRVRLELPSHLERAQSALTESHNVQLSRVRPVTGENFFEVSHDVAVVVTVWLG